MSNIPETYPGSSYQILFDHMQEQHGLILLTTEMSDIIEVCRKIIELEKQINNEDTASYS